MKTTAGKDNNIIELNETSDLVGPQGQSRLRSRLKRVIRRWKNQDPTLQELQQAEMDAHNISDDWEREEIFEEITEGYKMMERRKNVVVQQSQNLVVPPSPAAFEEVARKDWYATDDEFPLHYESVINKKGSQTMKTSTTMFEAAPYKSLYAKQLDDEFTRHANMERLSATNKNVTVRPKSAKENNVTQKVNMIERRSKSVNQNNAKGGSNVNHIQLRPNGGGRGKRNAQSPLENDKQKTINRNKTPKHPLRSTIDDLSPLDDDDDFIEDYDENSDASVMSNSNVKMRNRGKNKPAARRR